MNITSFEYFPQDPSMLKNAAGKPIIIESLMAGQNITKSRRLDFVGVLLIFIAVARVKS